MGFLVRAGGFSAALGLVVMLSACSSDDDDSERTPVTREVQEAPSAAASDQARQEEINKLRLEGERNFTYFDTAYGKCLKEHGVTELPPLSEPLTLDTSDPAVGKAADACKDLAPS
ncbi:hypothetical protein GCM10009555_097480 [Acrocarpospora macrocephala]|uniref:Lipoprotein n=1 Tax=Acrocarpospora macrocephala TaxID=150177 RepID=A0A5M3WVD3_9ACTN|nr:hypothetical protein [Acrocarpospora macrocephala]GES12670.1 hypothetical protein Amac_062670 [Acrocarpospora macrocephala]